MDNSKTALGGYLAETLELAEQVASVIINSGLNEDLQLAALRIATELTQTQIAPGGRVIRRAARRAAKPT